VAKTITKASPPKIEGVKETLKVLNKFDSTLRKQFNNQFKEAVQPTVEAAKANVPSQPPLSGWERNWKGKPLWDGEKEDRRIRLKINTRRVRLKTIERGMVYDNVGAIVVQATGRGLAVFDMAGRRGEPSTVRGDLMVKNLNDRWRKASRAMWPAAEETQDQVTRNCIPIVKRAELEAQRLLARQVINRGR
jgi:hypothetical protein